MKLKTITTILALAALSTISSQLATARAQGALTPPGAPAPTMKSLDQIESRTAITNRTSVFTIAEPGSYYLTGNLTVATNDAIIVNTNNVTLDLNGYTIRSTCPSVVGYGIMLNGNRSDITILNGHIVSGTTNNGSGVFSGNGFNSGIYTFGTPANVIVSHVSVSGVGVHGINLSSGGSTLVESCTTRNTGHSGISASTVKNCLAIECNFTAISGDQVSDSRGESYNIYGVSAKTAVNCYGESVNSIGLVTTVANNCVGYRFGGTAIQAAVANGCYAIVGTNNITYKYNMP
ncbi:MAG: hypothetical protein U1F65_10805 [Verrucomicrobiota bacterium]